MNRYVEYDAEEIWRVIEDSHIAAGGDLLYPGDEKEIMLRGVQMALVHMMASADAGIRLATLDGAVGVYLDDYGRKRKCERIEGVAAVSQIRIEFADSATARTIPAGTAVTADGQRMYLLDEAVEQTGYAQTVVVGITCADAGIAGNGLAAETQMQFVTGNPAVLSVYTTVAATGGREREDDESYRERIKTYGLVNSTTGSATQYESAARKVSTGIIDVHAMHGTAGLVTMVLLAEDGADVDALIAEVKEALSPIDTRPLTDTVEVIHATALPYVLNLRYAQPTGSNIAEAVQKAVEDYQAEQDREIGRPFNADRLMAMVYQAGATRVEWGEGSDFNGNGIGYAPIAEYCFCKGRISIEVMEE